MHRPLDAALLRAAHVAPAGPYAAIDVVQSTGSTNADLREAAAAGAADRTALFAEEQTAGAGRLGRSWVSPAGSGLYLSVLLRPPAVLPGNVGSLAAVAGLALADAALAHGVQTTLKWPNDVLASGGPADGGKLAGVLSELVPAEPGQAIVLGMGLNVHPLGADVPPGPGGIPATSLAEAGASEPDRAAIADTLLRALMVREQAWRTAGGDLEAAGLLDDYRSACSTLGTQVEVQLPAGPPITGQAVDVDAAGQLVVETPDGGRTTVLAGDVVHLR